MVKLQNFMKIEKYFGPKISYMGVFRIKFQKTNVNFEISTLEFIKNNF